MDIQQSGQEAWESQAQIDEALKAEKVSRDQINRWRREGLLPDVEQVPDAFHGSQVRYPVGTCKQIAAAARLFKVKNRSSYVGWQLWWEGFPVDAKHWRLPLVNSARTFENHLHRVIRFMHRPEEAPSGLTLQEKVAKSRVSNFILSRIRQRLWGEGLASHIGVILSVATGDFVGFSLPGPNEEKAFDKERTIEALDLGGSERDNINGKRLNFVGVLPDVLATISRTIKPGVIQKVADGPEMALEVARCDVRNGLQTAVSLYEALSWIYGPEAFGLRLAAWIGKKHPMGADRVWILGMAALRTSNMDFYSPSKILEMAEQSEKAQRDSMAMKALWKNDPRFREVFSPPRIRRAYQDKVSYEIFQREICCARDSIG
jgi:hypothetical protein